LNGSPKAIRCAIYTRKSTEEGLDRSSTRSMPSAKQPKAYITSQKEAGWKLFPDRYDDGGFSGGTLERPALQAGCSPTLTPGESIVSSFIKWTVSAGPFSISPAW